MEEEQWKIPKCMKGELRWKNGWHWQDVFVEVPISTIVLYPKNKRNLVLKSIPFTQISEISQTSKMLSKCFTIHLKNGETFLFQCTDKNTQSVKKWVQSFTHAKSFWASKEMLSQKRQRPRKVTSVHCEGGCIWIFFTLTNNELFVVLVNNTSTFNDVYPHLFGSCQDGACSTCKIRHQSCKLWAVDTSGTKRLVGKDEILAEYNRQGYMLYVLEHRQKLLILHYNDASYDVMPVSCKITAQEPMKSTERSHVWWLYTWHKNCFNHFGRTPYNTDSRDKATKCTKPYHRYDRYNHPLHHPGRCRTTWIYCIFCAVLEQEKVATKLKELGCLNPGLFLKVENGKELLFHSNDELFQYQHGRFVAKSKALMRLKSKEKTKNETISELRWKMYLQSYQTKKMDEYLNEAGSKSFINEDSGLSFANDHFAVVCDKQRAFSAPLPFQNESKLQRAEDSSIKTSYAKDESKCYGKNYLTKIDQYKEPELLDGNIQRDSSSRTDGMAHNVENGQVCAVNIAVDVLATKCSVSGDLMSKSTERNVDDEHKKGFPESCVETVNNPMEMTKETVLKNPKESKGSYGEGIAGAEIGLSTDKTKSNSLAEYQENDKNDEVTNVVSAEISKGNKDNENNSDTRFSISKTRVCSCEAQMSNEMYLTLKDNALKNNVSGLCRSISDTAVLKNAKHKKHHSSQAAQFVDSNLHSISLPDLQYLCNSSSSNITMATSVPDLNTSDECLRVNDVFIASVSSDDDDLLPCSHHVTCGETSLRGLDWQVAKKVEKAVLSILAAQRGSQEVNKLISNLLYPALLEIFENGLKRNASFLMRIFSRVDVWDVCKAISHDSKIAKALILDTEDEARIPSTKFLYFLRCCINKSYLSHWFELLREVKVQERVIKYYDKDALVLKMINAPSMEHIKVFLDKLDGLKLVKESFSGNTDNVNNLFIFE